MRNIGFVYILTRTTLSLAEMASISAQETTAGQTCSTADLIWSITSNPLAELLFGLAVFSPVNVGVSSNSIDASQPYNYNKTNQYMFETMKKKIYIQT